MREKNLPSSRAQFPNANHMHAKSRKNARPIFNSNVIDISSNIGFVREYCQEQRNVLGHSEVFPNDIGNLEFVRDGAQII